MVETIAPVVHGGKNRRYWLSVALHVIGAALSAAALGLLLGAIGAAFDPSRNVALSFVVAVAVLYAARELFGVPVPLPDLDRQVPDWWRTFFAPPVAAFLYGLGLGVGFLTFLSFGTLVAVAVGAVVAGDPIVGAELMTPFGIARGASVVFGARTTTAEVESRVQRLQDLARSRGPRLVNGGTLLAVALAAAVAA